MRSALLVLAGLVLGALVGYLAGWIRRDRTVTGDTLEWWAAGWNAAAESFGGKPAHPQAETPKPKPPSRSFVSVRREGAVIKTPEFDVYRRVIPGERE